MKSYEYYNNLDDKELIKKIREGDDDAKNELYLKYERLIKSMANNYYLKHSSTEDIIQILSLGFTVAINNYNVDSVVSFIVYAKRCMKNKITDYIRRDNTKKNDNKVTISYLFSNAGNNSETDQSLIDILADDTNTPEKILMEKDSIINLINELNNLDFPDIYYYILHSREDGKTCVEIACDLDIDKKDVYNIIQTIKRKLFKK